MRDVRCVRCAACFRTRVGGLDAPHRLPARPAHAAGRRRYAREPAEGTEPPAIAPADLPSADRCAVFSSAIILRWCDTAHSRRPASRVLCRLPKPTGGERTCTRSNRIRPGMRGTGIPRTGRSRRGGGCPRPRVSLPVSLAWRGWPTEALRASRRAPKPSAAGRLVVPLHQWASAGLQSSRRRPAGQ
jgi:hypothetical protein